MGMGLNGARILYVEDEPMVREVTSLFLARAGYEVESAADGHIALERIAPDVSAFDMVITDCQMPRIGGVELVQRLREIAFPGRIIVFSSSLDPTLSAKFLALGVHGLVHKGTTPQALLGALKAAESRPASE